jgi:hypothetical protein
MLFYVIFESFWFFPAMEKIPQSDTKSPYRHKLTCLIALNCQLGFLWSELASQAYFKGLNFKRGTKEVP